MLWRRWWLILLCLLLEVIPAGAAQTPATSIADYWQLVNETSLLINQLLRDNQPDAHQQLLNISGRWRAIHFLLIDEVSLTVIPFDQTPMVNQLEADPPNLRGLRDTFNALQAARANWPEPTYDQTTGDEAKAALQRILARPEFQWQPQQAGLLEQLWKQILDLTARLLAKAGDLTWLTYLAIAGGALFLFFVLLFIGRGLFGNFVNEIGNNQADDGAEQNLTADSALQKAQELSKGGDLRSAIRYLYLSTLLLLDERGILRYERWRTNREYLQSVANRPELVTTLQDVVDVFDRTWYGFEPVDQAIFDQYEQRVVTLKQQK